MPQYLDRDGDTCEMRSVFLLGCPTALQPELVGTHALVCPCPDDYPSLPQRTRWFCRWALAQNDWDYLFKCDDDTYVSITRLSLYDLAGRDYVGAEWKPGVGYGSGGAGYFLSRKAATAVAERLEQPCGAEDGCLSGRSSVQCRPCGIDRAPAGAVRFDAASAEAR